MTIFNLLISFRSISALPKIDRVLKFCKVHGAIETIHGDAIIRLVVILIIVVLLLLLLRLLLRM
jgi:hypothetical protein